MAMILKKTLVLFAVILINLESSKGQAQKKNVLFIVGDDMGMTIIFY